MKIMSLNVNQFRPIPVRGIFAEAKTKEIIAFIKAFLFSNQNNVVFLQEVQKWLITKGTLESMLNGTMGKKFFKIIVPLCKTSPYTYTVAIIREGSGWEEQVDGFKSINDGLFENRFLEIKQDELELRLLGVHAPLESKYRKPEDVQKFFDALKIYAKNNTNEKLMILGDLNCHKGEKSTHKSDLEEMSEHFPDLVGDTDITYFPGGTTIDHVLISKELERKTVAQVIPREILELSDHAVIIVTIDE